MLARELMSSPAVTVRPSTTVKEAIELLERHTITAMPVVDRRGRLIGVVSEADVIRDALLPDPRSHDRPVRGDAEPRPTLVVDVMSHHALTVPAEADLSEAVELMVSTAVKSLPVTAHGRVVGMISRRDVIRLLARQDELMEIEADELIRTSGYDWLTDVKDGVVLVDGPRTPKERALAEVLVGTVPGVVRVDVGTRAG